MFGELRAEERATDDVDAAIDAAMQDAISWSRWLSAHLDRAVRVGDCTLAETLLHALWHSPRVVDYTSSIIMVSAAPAGDPRAITTAAAATWHRNRGDGRRMEALAGINNINKRNPVTGQQPLHVATHLGNRLAVRALLANGADVNGRAYPPAGDVPDHGTGLCSLPLALLRGMTALHWAALRGYWEIVEDLLSCGADVDARVAESGETSLHLAARHKRDVVVGVLLDSGARPLVLSRYNLTPMDLAAMSNDPGTLSEFLYRGVDPNSKNALGYTAVHQAAYSNSTATLQLLLDFGGGVNSITAKGHTPLHVAAAFSCARPAPAAGAAGGGESNPNSSERGGAGASAVRTIARSGGEFLNVDAVDDAGATPLRTACVRLREQAVLDLLEIGADEQLVGDLSHGDFAPRDGGKNSDGDGSGVGSDPASAATTSLGGGTDASGDRADSIARVLAMLASASADRAWRRRGWLAVLRARATAVRDGASRDSRNSVSADTRSRYCMGSAGGRVVRRSSRKRRSPCLGDDGEVVDVAAACQARRGCDRGGVAAVDAASALGSSERGKDQGMAAAVGMMTALADEEVFRRIMLYL